MSDMTPAAEQWSLYSAAQNLPAVLNDPNRGKQTNFFIKTWGDTFVERSHIEKSPFLPEITYAHFDNYIRKVGKRYKRHLRLIERRPDVNHVKTRIKTDLVNGEISINSIPEIFLKQQFPLNDPSVFLQVFYTKDRAQDHVLQEELSHYLDIVEVQIAKQVAQKSDAFFHAMTSHDTIMEQMGVAHNVIKSLRFKVQTVDKTLAKDSLHLIGLARSKANHTQLIDKLKLMAIVLQTQPTLQLLLNSSDYVAAVELISSTQEVLTKELAGVTSLRHLPSQLKEMSKLINKMLTLEFEKYAGADLNRPLYATDELLDHEHLVSLVAGLLRQNHLQFLETYKQEAVTATQTLLKHLLAEELADVEDENEHCLTGSGEVAPSMDAARWLKVLTLASHALGKLLQRVKGVHDVIKETADASAGLNFSTTLQTSETFLSIEDHNRVETKLKDLVGSACDYCHERLASLVSTHSERQTVTSSEITELMRIVDNFTDLCEKICGRQSPALRAAFKIQAGNYLNKFHSQRKSKLTMLLDAERWKVAEVPQEIQNLVDKLAVGELKSLPSTPTEERFEEKKPLPFLQIGVHHYYSVGTVLILVQLVCEYCVCAYNLQFLASTVARHLAELLRTFNSRCCQLVLGAGALKTAGLKTITSTNLALTSRSLQMVLWMIPHIRSHLKRFTNNDPLVSFDTVENDIGHHIQLLENKVLSIIETLVGEQLSEWDAKPPVPSKAFRNISKQMTKLHEAVSAVLPDEQVMDMYETIHKKFKSRLRDQLIKLNIQNNGSPQHGVVTTEIMFYLQTMTTLRVLPLKYLTDNAMNDIWTR